jgi:hypothetical protein
MPANHFTWGDWWAICDVCGFKHKSSELLKRWDGKMVCPKDMETRHPQDFARIPRTEKPIPWARPEPTVVERDVDWVASDVGTQS